MPEQLTFPQLRNIAGLFHIARRMQTIRRGIGLAVATCLLAATASAQYSAPRIFFSDLQSGPNTGGQNNAGAIVTVYGAGFGSSRGSSQVTVGGGAAAGYLAWSDKKVSFQLGSSAKTGNIVVTVGGVSSNGLAFTVRAGNIYFVATTGNDGNSGAYSSPWATLGKAKNTIAAGAIVYAMNGVTQTGLDANSASLSITRSGSSGAPMAIVAYPGATVTIGSASGQPYGVRASSGQWVLAGLTLRGGTSAFSMSGGTSWRLVGNDISCPNGTGAAGCVQASNANDWKLLGNAVHDSGSTSSTDVAGYNSVSVLQASRNVEVGWNDIGRTRACYAVRFYSTGTKQYSLTVHDNYIHAATCSGISFSGIDPSSGAVRAQNNVVAQVGTGPAPGGSEADAYAGVDVAAGSTTAVKINNNTFSDCGARGNGNSGAVATAGPVLLLDNIFSMASGELYVSSNSNISAITGNNNLFNGAGTPPGYLQNSVTGDPKFLDPPNNNFRLQSASPAIDRGASSAATRDYDGVPRPQGAKFDIGAFEYSGTSPVPTTAQLSSSPASLNFGTVNVGASSTQSVTLSNSGTGSATISQVSSTNPVFAVAGLTAPATLAAGQSLSYTVTFTPTAAGSASGTVSVLSNAANSPTGVTLTGSGANPNPGTSHSVALSWQASPSTGIAGYSVYRATQANGTYSKLNTSVVSGLSYTDLAVTAGATYYYFVRAVDQSGVESANSNQAQATVPTP